MIINELQLKKRNKKNVFIGINKKLNKKICLFIEEYIFSSYIIRMKNIITYWYEQYQQQKESDWTQNWESYVWIMVDQ